MPAYNSQATPPAIAPGDSAFMLNAEQLGGSSSKASQQVNIQDKDTGFTRPVTVTFAYATAPAAVQYDIYVAWDDVPANYTKVGSSVNVAGEQVTIQRQGPAMINFRFVRVLEVISPGVNATVQARQ